MLLLFALSILLILSIIVLGIFLFQLLHFFYLLYIQTQGAFFVPLADEKLTTMLELAEVKPGMKLLDLGSGDGKIVISAAELGVEAHGCELDWRLVHQSQAKIRQAGLTQRATIFHQNLWSTSLQPYDVITVYGIGYMMKRLEQKARKELKPGAKVISYYFTFPNWQPATSRDHIHVYVQDSGRD